MNYLLIPGDVVDGIGIYPDQEKELDVDDIYEQYHVLAEYLKEIPDSIRIIVQPGNHDAVRPAEPQPAFEGDFAKMFDSNAILIGNPCYLNIEGRTILSYHGKSVGGRSELFQTHRGDEGDAEAPALGPDVRRQDAAGTGTAGHDGDRYGPGHLRHRARPRSRSFALQRCPPHQCLDLAIADVVPEDAQL